MICSGIISKPFSHNYLRRATRDGFFTNSTLITSKQSCRFIGYGAVTYLNYLCLFWSPRDVNILGGSVHTVEESAEALVVATKEIGLDVNADKTKYMIMSRDQNAGRSHSMKTDNNSIERVEQFKYLGTTLTNKNSIQ